MPAKRLDTTFGGGVPQAAASSCSLKKETLGINRKTMVLQHFSWEHNVFFPLFSSSKFSDKVLSMSYGVVP